jgi:hypothetical protein
MFWAVPSANVFVLRKETIGQELVCFIFNNFVNDILRPFISLAMIVQFVSFVYPFNPLKLSGIRQSKITK